MPVPERTLGVREVLVDDLLQPLIEDAAYYFDEDGPMDHAAEVVQQFLLAFFMEDEDL